MLSNSFKDKVKRDYKPIVIKVGVMDGVYPDGTTVASVAMYNEYGDTNTPPRPFMRNTMLDKSGIKTDVAKIFRKEIPMETKMSQVGEMLASRIKKQIGTGEFAPLKTATIQRKGFEKPLIDTSLMLKSITWKEV